MKKFLLSITLMFSLIAFAQEGKVEKKSELTHYLNSGKKLGFTAEDSIFQMNIGFRIQSRGGFQKEEGEGGFAEGEVRRMRLKLDGFVYNPKFGYKVEWAFAAKDMATTGSNGNVVLDGVFFYKPTKHWKISFGQTKLPGNLQRVVSSGALEFTDRTINNSRFNIDRDFGLFVDYTKGSADKFSYALKTALTRGEGRNYDSNDDDGICLTGKLELYPFGQFTKNGAYFEADLVREKTPKLMISGAFSQNNHAVRAQGQLGSDLFEARTLKSVFFDAVFKYKGWQANSAYMSRKADNPITVGSTGTRAVVVGNGIDAQLSYVFPSRYSIAGRFSTQKFDDDMKIKDSNTADVDEYAISFSKYLKDHKLKIQTEFSHQDSTDFAGVTTGSWYARVQVEIGI